MPSSRFASRLVAALAVALGALLWSGPARAYCREVTDYPPNGYDPVDAGCFTAEPDGGALSALFWRNECVSYSFQKQGSKYISMDDAARITAQAFGAWSNATCPGGSPSITAVPFPPVDCDGQEGSQEHSNLIVFRDDAWPHDDSSNVIGYTTLTVDLSTGEIFGAEIEVNSHDYTIVTDLDEAGPPRPGTMTVDVGTILTHEAGHFLGLAHSGDTSAVMFAHYQPGTTALTPDDVSGICAIYDPGGTHATTSGVVASTTCDPTPRQGFLSTECGALDAGTASMVGSGSIETTTVNPSTPCPDLSGCTMGRTAATPGTAKLGALGLFALGIVVRRTRRGSRRARRTALALGGALALTAAGASSARDASASTSVSALFEELVEGSSAAAVVTPTEQQAVWEGGRIATYTRLRVDRLVAGKLPREIWVRTAGGAVGHIGQIVEGEAKFAIDHPSLVFVRPHVDAVSHAVTDSFVVVDRAQGQFPVAGSEGQQRLALAADIGALLAQPQAHVARASQRLPAGDAPRAARDVLEGRPLDDAAHDIATAWPRMHPPSP